MKHSSVILKHGLNIRLKGQNLNISPKEKITPELRAYIRSNKVKIIEEIKNTVWEPKMQQLIDWFEANIKLLPTEPFVYHRGDYENLRCTIIWKTPESLYQELKREIAKGPAGHHAKDGIIVSILGVLHGLYAEEKCHSPPFYLIFLL